MKILSVDPGVTTGLCFYNDEHKEGAFFVEAQRNHLRVWAYVYVETWDCVICENFSSAGLISAAGQHTIRIIGGVEALCKLRNVKYCLHTPAIKLPYMDEAKHELKKIGRKFTPHEQDALAQLIAHKRFHHA